MPSNSFKYFRAQLSKCYKLWSLFLVWKDSIEKMMAFIWSEMNRVSCVSNDSSNHLVGYNWHTCAYAYRLLTKRKCFTAKCVCIINIHKWLRLNGLNAIRYQIRRSIIVNISFEEKNRGAKNPKSKQQQQQRQWLWFTFA